MALKVWLLTALQFQNYHDNVACVTHTRLKQICAYADDIVIIGRTKQILIDTFYKLKQEALNVGLIVNNNTTKYLYCTRKTNHPTYLDTGEEQFEQVNSFNLLEPEFYI